jgi:cytosine/creatinine deaminase
MDLIVRNARRPDDAETVDIGVRGATIVAVEPRLDASAATEIDARGYLVSPPFVDPHFHLDSTLTAGFPRWNASGTLHEGIELWGELQEHLAAEGVRERARTYIRWAVSQGILHIRTHVDVCHRSLLAAEALLEVRDEMRDLVDIQMVAFPQHGFLRFPGAVDLLDRALDMGFDVVGGIPHYEATREEGVESVLRLMERADRRNLLVDMHCDETDDPASRFVEVLARETVRRGMQGRVTGSHLTSMHSIDNPYAGKLVRLIADAGLHVAANPLTNILLQGRFDTYPKRRGVTRVKELLAEGVNVAFGQDCTLDPWYPLGKADMLQVAFMGLHICHMSGIEEIDACFDAVTASGARALGLSGSGLEVGCQANMVVLQAGTPRDAIRLQPPRLRVIRQGSVVAETTPSASAVLWGGERHEVDFSPPGFA